MNEQYKYPAAPDVAPGVPRDGDKDVKKEAVSRTIIGERVRLARMAANMTQQDLAGSTYSKSYISAVERGKMTPSFQALHILAERLGRPISYFLGEGGVTLETLLRSKAAAPVFSEEERQQREGGARKMLEDAEGWLDKNQPEQALEALHVAANAPPDALPPAERPRWYLMAGRATLRAKKSPEAIDLLNRGLAAVEEARAWTPPTKKAQLNEMAERIRTFLGGCYYDQGQPATAREYHLRCQTAILDGVVTDLELKLRIYKALGNDNMALERYDEAILYYKQACKLATDLIDPRQEGLTYWGQGLAYKSIGQFFLAETAFQEALMIFERLNDVEQTLSLHSMLAQLLTRMKDYRKADQHLQLALETAKRLGNSSAQRVALGGIAILRMEQGNFGEAIKAAQAALALVVEGDDHRIEGQLYQTLAEAYEAAQVFPAAEQAYQKALTLLEQYEEKRLIGQAYERFGKFLAAQGRFAEAYEQMENARKLLEQKSSTP